MAHKLPVTAKLSGSCLPLNPTCWGRRGARAPRCAHPQGRLTLWTSQRRSRPGLRVSPGARPSAHPEALKPKGPGSAARLGASLRAPPPEAGSSLSPPPPSPRPPGHQGQQPSRADTSGPHAVLHKWLPEAGSTRTLGSHGSSHQASGRLGDVLGEAVKPGLQASGATAP